MNSANAATALASVFLNLFLFVVAGQLGALIWFNVAYFGALTVVFFGAAAVFRGRPPMVLYRWGLALTIAFYAVVLGLAQQSSHYVVPLGLFYAVAQGVYWFGVNLLSFDTVPAASRMRFFGYSSALFSVTGVVGPTLGSGIVAAFSGIEGYLLVFGLGLVGYLVALLTSIRIPLGPPMDYSSRWGQTRLWGRPDWRLTFKTIAVRGTREGVTGMAGVYLVYLATHRAWTVGVYAGLTALTRVLGSVTVTHKASREHRVSAMLIGVVGMTGAAGLLLLGQSWPWVFAYGLIAALAMPFYTVPNASVSLDVMDRDQDITRRRVGYMLSREVALNMGRLTSIGVLVVGAHVWPASGVLIALLIGTSAVQGWVALAVHWLFGPRYNPGASRTG